MPLDASSLPGRQLLLNRAAGTWTKIQALIDCRNNLLTSAELCLDLLASVFILGDACSLEHLDFRAKPRHLSAFRSLSLARGMNKTCSEYVICNITLS